MTDLQLIFCTFPDLAQARQIGTALIQRQLATCVNFLPGVESIYRWEGKIKSKKEVLAIFKTTVDSWVEFERVMTEMHPYDVPEIVALEPSQVAEPYRRWVTDRV